MHGDSRPDTLKELLTQSTMTLSTSDSKGAPHAAPVYFSSDESLTFFFFSSPDSLHARHVAENARVAAAIFAEGVSWKEIRGLQLRGNAKVISDAAELTAAEQRYADKFPFVTAMGDLLARNRLYSFTPTWIRIIDNRRGFGWKEEHQLTAFLSDGPGDAD